MRCEPALAGCARAAGAPGGGAGEHIIQLGRPTGEARRVVVEITP